MKIYFSPLNFKYQPIYSSSRAKITNIDLKNSIYIFSFQYLLINSLIIQIVNKIIGKKREIKKCKFINKQLLFYLVLILFIKPLTSLKKREAKNGLILTMPLKI